MKTSRTQVASIISERTLNKGLSKPLSREVGAYLLEEGRVGELDSILRDVQADWAEAGQVEVIAASAHTLSSAVKNDIKLQVKKLYPTAKQIIISEIIDPVIIGGVKLSLPGRQLDMSVEAKLNKFKQLTLNGKD